jgi:hypothetical protein
MLRMDECRMLTKMSVTEKEAITDVWRKFKNVQLIICTPGQTLLIL